MHSNIKPLEDKENKKGVSNKDSSTAFSVDFFSCMQYNPVLFYFCKVFIACDLLESCALDMLDKHVGNSLDCSSTSHRNLPPKKEKMQRKR